VTQYAENTAGHALREAAAALCVGCRSCRTRSGTEADCRVLAADVAEALDAMVALLRAAGLGSMPTSAASHGLFAVLQGVSASAVTARRAAGPDSRQVLSQPRRSAQVLGVSPDD
jgi:hypothetical protein